MGIYYEKTKPLIKREATVADVSLKIQRNGSDNLYPQRAEEILRRSSTLKSVTNRLADFVNGEGFADENIAKMIVNRKGLKGQSANKVLGIVSKTFVKWETKVAHVGFNMLGQMCEFNPLPFETIRFGIANKEGCVTHLGYSANYELDGRSGREQNIVFYPVFNPDPEVVLQQMEAAGGIENYKGQIIFDTPEPFQYPPATFDAVLDDAQVQGEIGLFKVGNTQNSFLATLAILYPGEFGSTQEENDFKNLIANKSGSRNAGTRIGLQDKSGQRKASDIFQTLQPTNLDKVFEYTETSVKKNIMQSESFPAILMGDTPTGLFAQGDIEEVYTYVNSITRNRRAELSEFFSTIFSYWETPIVTDADIIEQRYIKDGNQAAGPGTGDMIQVNDNIKNMTGMQAVQFERILRKYGKGQYTRDVATQMLQAGFGLTTEEINKLLDGIDQLVAEEKAAQDPQGVNALQRRQKYLAYVETKAIELL